MHECLPGVLDARKSCLSTAPSRKSPNVFTTASSNNTGFNAQLSKTPYPQPAGLINDVSKQPGRKVDQEELELERYPNGLNWLGIPESVSF